LVEEFLDIDTKMKPVDYKRERTKTNNEIATDEYLSSAEHETIVNIPNKYLNGLENELNEIKELLNDLYNSRDSVPYELSESYEMFYNKVYNILDRFKYELYDMQSNKPQIIIECIELNRNFNVDRKDINSIQKSITKFKKKINQLYNLAMNLEIPPKSVVKKEIEDAELERIEQQMKDMKEFRDRFE